MPCSPSALSSEKTVSALANLSVIIIAKNESKSLEDCLRSVAWAAERIVLDGGSSDDTVAIAQRLGARVEMAADWPGFGPQKNRVLSYASAPWVLSLDADERVTPDLAAEIQRLIVSADARPWYRMPRSSSYCGRTLRRGGWWPDYVTRLFRRGAARFSQDQVHERLIPEVGQGAMPLGTLQHPLLHATYSTLEEVLDKANRYSSLGARQDFAKGRRAGLAQALGHGAWAFFRTYVLRGGLLEGGHGFLLAVSNAHTTFYRYAKLWLLRQ